jgi:DNA polymerase I-like protein with 3'-5' exonuclease and polymerase domains
VKIVDYPLMPKPRRVDVDSVPVTLITGKEALAALAERVKVADHVAVDTETHDAHVLRNGLWGAVRTIQLALGFGPLETMVVESYVIDVRDVAVADVAEVLAAVPVARGWNANFDEEVLEIYGAPVGTWRDAMLDDAVLWAGMPGRSFYLGLAVAADRYIGVSVDGKGTVQTSFDGTTDLNADQVRYAARDAIVTLYVSLVLEEMLIAQDVKQAADITQGARPFAVMAQRAGFPFDIDGWGEFLANQRVNTEKALADLARLTGETGERPSWNPSSADDFKVKLNEFALEYVEKLFGRPMDEADSVDKATMIQLKNLGCELAGVMLTYRAGAKIDESFSADKLGQYFWEGGVHSRYLQALTATGRWSSREPNGQNLPGATKSFIRPADQNKVIVQADYSGAELRVLGTLAGETAWLDTFRSGGDLHAENATKMFKVDYEGLLVSDPKAAKKARTKAKTVGFGMPYNMGAGLLARTLSNSGVETSFKEAKEIVDAYYTANPHVAAYLKGRDAFIEGIAADPGEVDWDASFKLLEVFLRFDSMRRGFKQKNKRLPSPAELAELALPRKEQLELFAEEQSDEDLDAERAVLAADIEWAFRYDAPVVLRPNGEPLAWESRTVGNRRRIFCVVMASGFQRSENEAGSGSDVSDKFSGVVTSAMLMAATTDKPHAARIRDTWAGANGVKLPDGIDRCVMYPGEAKAAYRERRRTFEMEERKRCVKAFEGKNKPLMPAFVRYVMEQMGPEAARFLLNKALADQVRKSIGAFRNHPIQGAVATIAEAAFAELMKLCEEYPDLVWVQTVHDSIVGMCDEHHAVEVCTRQKLIMEQVMADLVPGIPAKADAEVSRSCDDADIIHKIPDVPAGDLVTA